VAEWTERIPHPASASETAALRAVFEARYHSLSSPAVVLLPSESVLRTGLILPQAAARHLEEAAGYQIERLSPFPPASTLYGIGSQKQETPSGEIAVQIVIAANDFVGGIEARASALGLRSIGFAVEADAPAGFERIAFAGRQASSTGLPLRIRALLAATALLASTVIVAPIVSKSLGLTAIEAEIQRLKPEAEQAAKLRSARETQLSILTKASALTRAAPSPLALLTKLTAALDDTSFLIELRLEGATLTLSGLSSDASALAQKLGAIGEFKSVKFVGPVTRDAQAARDRFTLVLELEAPP
jgi:general secretion pathway protein L